MRRLGLMGIIGVASLGLIGCTSMQVESTYTVSNGAPVGLVAPSDGTAVISGVQIDLTAIDFGSLGGAEAARIQGLLPEIPSDAKAWLILNADKE